MGNRAFPPCTHFMLGSLLISNRFSHKSSTGSKDNNLRIKWVQGSGCLRLSSPLTAVGPSLTCTGFPFKPI